VRVLDEPADQDAAVQCSSVARTVGQIPILYCKGCRGMLVAMQAMEELIAASRPGSGVTPAAAADPEDLQRKIIARNATIAWTRISMGPGTYHRFCEDCSLIWMDGGALMRMPAPPNCAPRRKLLLLRISTSCKANF